MASAVIGKVLSIAAASTQVIPLVGGLIHLVEDLFRGTKRTGTQKKEAVQQMVSDAVNIYATVAPLTGKVSGAGTSDYQAALSEYIDATVKFLNATGAFVHAQ